MIYHGLRRLIRWLLGFQTHDTLPRDWILLDGSNVMYWNDQTPQMEPVRDAVKLLTAKGLVPKVIFDANAGYLVSEGYMHDDDFARVLDLSVDQVVVVEKGVPADLELLKSARIHKAKVVTNDRFRDWAKRFPEVRKRGHLVHGGFHKGKLWLDFDGSRPREGGSRRKRR